MVKKLLISLLICSFGVSFPLQGIVFADEIEDLKIQMRQLRDDYESKRNALQQKIEEIGKKQAVSEEKLEKKIEDKTISLDYVGRYQGPFGKGCLLIKNPSGFGNVS